MWNFLRRRAAGGYIIFQEHQLISLVWSISESLSEPDAFSQDFHVEKTRGIIIFQSRDVFFETILRELSVVQFSACRGLDDSFSLCDIMSGSNNAPSISDLEDNSQDPYRGGYIRDIVEDPRIAE